MSSSPSPVSIVAERAVRYLRERERPVDSVQLANEVLATRVSDERTATRVLETAFQGDSRLCYVDGGWIANRSVRAAGGTVTTEGAAAATEPPRALLLLDGGRPRGGREFVLRHVVMVRVEQDCVTAACGGEVGKGPGSDELRAEILELLDGSVPVVHDPPGALSALEAWLGAPLGTPISVRRLAHERLGLPARHHLESLAARLGLSWRETGDRLDLADVLDTCLDRLRSDGETLLDLQRASTTDGAVVDWSRVDFEPAFLRSIPHTAGTYRFFDRRGRLLYVGKSRNLNRRVGSYFVHDAKRSERRRAMLASLYRIEVEPTGSDLEAVLREATQIRKLSPATNVQREVHAREGHESRLRSILILEPGIGTVVLRAYLIRDWRLVARVGIGPRGGGLARIERILEDRFFLAPDGPTPATGPDLDVELVMRWLAANRDRIVAFDPTDLQSAAEVIDRLRWFLAHGGPFETDGSPIRTR